VEDILRRDCPARPSAAQSVPTESHFRKFKGPPPAALGGAAVLPRLTGEAISGGSHFGSRTVGGQFDSFHRSRYELEFRI
jgi:hypothetical protein